MKARSGYRVETTKEVDLPEIEKDWLDLQRRSSCSYFQSWGWISTWLDLTVRDLNPLVIRVYDDQRLVGAAVFVPASSRRRYIVFSRGLYLHEYPFGGRNMVMEYNGILAEKDSEERVYKAVIEYLMNHPSLRNIDELCFGAVNPRHLEFVHKAVADKYCCVVRDDSLAWKLALDRLDSGVEGYLAHLSRNRRGQIRRSIRLYEACAPIVLETAATADQALEYFMRLKALHTRHWNSRGRQGSFANANWENFHCALIRNRFDAGEIQLIRVCSGSEEIGYLYNLCLDGHVYVLQTGFADAHDSRLMPGYVTHACAIAYNRDQNMHTYDLMHGDDLYKQILCDQSETMYWVALQKWRFRFRLENAAVAVARKIRSRLH